MKGAITWRLAGMFAGVALATFALVGGALYLVLQRELVGRVDDQLGTYLQALEYSTARAGTLTLAGSVIDIMQANIRGFEQTVLEASDVRMTPMSKGPWNRVSPCSASPVPLAMNLF